MDIDLDAFCQMLDGAGVPYEKKKGGMVKTGTSAFERDEDAIIVTLEVNIIGDSKVKGYMDFFTEFVFNGDGSLREVGLWE